MWQLTKCDLSATHPPLPVTQQHRPSCRRSRDTADSEPEVARAAQPQPRRQEGRASPATQAPGIAWRWQLPHQPYPTAAHPLARVPSRRHPQPSAEPVGGAQLASPPPPGRGATAPSSLQMSGEMTVTAFPCFQRATSPINDCQY